MHNAIQKPHVSERAFPRTSKPREMRVVMVENGDQFTRLHMLN